MNNTDNAYMAGIVDGEGTIGLYNVKNGRGESRPCLCIVVCNTDVNLINWILARYGGNMHKLKQKDNHKQCYQIHWRNKKARELLEKIQQYLIIKKAP